MLPSLFATDADRSKPSVNSFNDFRDFASTSYAQNSVSLMSDKISELQWKLLMAHGRRPCKAPKNYAHISQASWDFSNEGWSICQGLQNPASAHVSSYRLSQYMIEASKRIYTYYEATRHNMSDKAYRKLSRAFGGIFLTRIWRRVLKMPKITGCCRIIASPTSPGSSKGSRSWRSWWGTIRKPLMYSTPSHVEVTRYSVTASWCWNLQRNAFV